jgi:signal transduction histidine kinase
LKAYKSFTQATGNTPRVRLALFRFYRNALTNVLRHSPASQVKVHLEIDPGQVGLIMHDDKE